MRSVVSGAFSPGKSLFFFLDCHQRSLIKKPLIIQSSSEDLNKQCFVFVMTGFQIHTTCSRVLMRSHRCMSTLAMQMVGWIASTVESKNFKALTSLKTPADTWATHFYRLVNQSPFDEREDFMKVKWQLEHQFITAPVCLHLLLMRHRDILTQWCWGHRW